MFLWMGAWDLVVEEKSKVTEESEESELSEKTDVAHAHSTLIICR